MSNQVYANNMEVSCKQAAGKSICAFPDVCFTPPQTPPTPTGVPIPYPNTGMASDTSDGSSSVKISGQEVMLKNKSSFKQSTGDEAGCAPKKGVISSKIKGQVQFTGWSMDVKIEGENVVRNFDLTTHNHGSTQNDGIPQIYIDRQHGPLKQPKPCKEDCPKEPSPEEYESVRKKSPSSTIRRKVRQDKAAKCRSCGRSKNSTPGLRTAADHTYPLKKTSQIPGFACLSFENQVRIANLPENFVPLCINCNSSKRDRLWSEWNGVVTMEITHEPEVKAAAEVATENAKWNIHMAILDADCK